MSFDIPMLNRFALHTAIDAKRVKRSESLIKLDRIYYRSLPTIQIDELTHEFFFQKLL